MIRKNAIANVHPVKRSILVSNLKPIVIADCVKEAEILWACKLVTSHRSFNSSSDECKLFRSMFRDSEIATSMKFSLTKISYVIHLMDSLIIFETR